jgi:hypothetical protein
MLSIIDVIDKIQPYSITQSTPSIRKIKRLLFYLLVKYSSESKMAVS